MAGKNLKHLHPFALSTAFNLVPEDHLFSRLMHAIVEEELSAASWFLDRPSGQDARQFGHILLRVTTVYAQRVQLHDLASVVLIQTTGPLCLCLLIVNVAILLTLLPPVLIILHAWPSCRTRKRPPKPTTHPRTKLILPRLSPAAVLGDIRLWTNTHPVIQIEKHGRRLRCGHQQIFELAKRMRTNHIALISRQHVAVSAFIDENVEVIQPEIGHDFIKLPLAVDRAQQLRLRELGLNYALRSS